MTFILARDRPENSFEEWDKAWAAYNNYLDSIKTVLPKSAYEFAVAPWHYNFEDHRSPHDGWVEFLTIQESNVEEPQHRRPINITVRLLAAYHDGHIEISYKNVKSYKFIEPFEEEKRPSDWLYDEIRLSEQQYCLHEIEWDAGRYWLIESEDITYKWLPFDQAKNDLI